MYSREDFSTDCLSLMQHVIKHGNTTIYEWQTGQKPTRIEEINLDFRIEDEEVQLTEDAPTEVFIIKYYPSDVCLGKICFY